MMPFNESYILDLNRCGNFNLLGSQRRYFFEGNIFAKEDCDNITVSVVLMTQDYEQITIIDTKTYEHIFANTVINFSANKDIAYYSAPVGIEKEKMYIKIKIQGGQANKFFYLAPETYILTVERNPEEDIQTTVTDKITSSIYYLP